LLLSAGDEVSGCQATLFVENIFITNIKIPDTACTGAHLPELLKVVNFCCVIISI
jgi:hypothetical protein